MPTVSIQHLETAHSLLSQLSTFDVDSLKKEVQKAIDFLENAERISEIDEESSRKNYEKFQNIITNLQDTIADLNRTVEVRDEVIANYTKKINDYEKQWREFERLIERQGRTIESLQKDNQVLKNRLQTISGLASESK